MSKRVRVPARTSSTLARTWCRNIAFIRLCGKVGLIRLPVTQEIAGSSPVRVATFYRGVSQWSDGMLRVHEDGGSNPLTSTKAAAAAIKLH